ncbi:hypothetical protein V865_008183 [Kwoniella europaea PYCC6329]|uniref:Uncharacterized protein n=1 Tax=Kwoniella europaea PYCC6329 TaxID=1423913 RepID=A0AAX4KWR7_9TREE
MSDQSNNSLSYHNSLEEYKRRLEWYETILISRKESLPELSFQAQTETHPNVIGTSGMRAPHFVGSTQFQEGLGETELGKELREVQDFLFRLTAYIDETSEQLGWSKNLMERREFDNLFNYTFHRNGGSQVSRQTKLIRNRDTKLLEEVTVVHERKKINSGRQAISHTILGLKSSDIGNMVDFHLNTDDPSELYSSIDTVYESITGKELLESMIKCYSSNTKYNPSLLDDLQMKINKIPDGTGKGQDASKMLKECFTDFHDFCKKRDLDIELHRDSTSGRTLIREIKLDDYVRGKESKLDEKDRID